MSKKRIWFVAAALVVMALLVALVWWHYESKGLPQKLTDKPQELFSFDGGTQHHLLRPMAVAVGAKGNIYVSDSGNNQIKIFDQKGSYLATFDTKIQLDTPYGLATLPNGSVLVSDMLNRRILQFSAEGKLQKVFISAKQGIKPGNLFYYNQQLYVADLANQQVDVFNLDAKMIKTYRANFSFPQGMALLGGKLVVADAGNSVLRVLDLDSSGNGEVIKGTQGGGIQFAILRGIAVDNLQRILVVDSGASTIRFLNSQGQNLFAIGGLGSGENHFRFPMGITIYGNGRIFVADWGNNCIQVWGYSK